MSNDHAHPIFKASLEPFAPKDRKIITRSNLPPIPIRMMDWCAYYEGDEENGARYGWGMTEAEAIADLKENVE